MAGTACVRAVPIISSVPQSVKLKFRNIIHAQTLIAVGSHAANLANRRAFLVQNLIRAIRKGSLGGKPVNALAVNSRRKQGDALGIGFELVDFLIQTTCSSTCFVRR